jgi:hypothetical protein
MSTKHLTRVTARDWFASGARRPYDPIVKTILEPGGDEHAAPPLHVFEKVVAPPVVRADTRWLTMLPGYPDGSYGYAQVDRYLGADLVKGVSGWPPNKHIALSLSVAATRG